MRLGTLRKITDEEMSVFVPALEKALGNPRVIMECHHDLRHSTRILEGMGFDKKRVAVVLKEFARNGGYCDCEVMLNVICG
jgi:hypothetical protein